MHNADQGLVFGAAGNVTWQPSYQAVHFWNGLCLGSHILFAPAADLTFDVTAGFAIIGQALVSKLHGVQRCNDAVHFVVYVAALAVGHAWQRLIPQHSARHKFHDVKSTANDGLIFAKHMHFGDRHRCTRKAFHDGKLSLNGMCRWQ